MRLYLDGHDFEFATQQIYMCMFPNSHAEFVSEKPTAGDFIISSLSKHSDKFVSETEIHIDGKVNCACGEAPLWE